MIHTYSHKVQEYTVLTSLSLSLSNHVTLTGGPWDAGSHGYGEHDIRDGRRKDAQAGASLGGDGSGPGAGAWQDRGIPAEETQETSQGLA